MKPPETCPHCGSANLNIRMSPLYKGQWMFLCGDCLGGGAYGAEAERDWWKGARAANKEVSTARQILKCKQYKLLA